MIVISCDYSVPRDRLIKFRGELAAQRRDGLILLPPGFRVEYVGEDEKVVLREADEND